MKSDSSTSSVESEDSDSDSKKRIAGWIENEDKIFAHQDDEKRSTIQEHVYHKERGIVDALGTAHKPKVILDASGPANGIDTQTKFTDTTMEKKTIIQAILGESKPVISQITTFSVLDSRAKLSRSLGRGVVLRTSVERFSLILPELRETKDHGFYYLKTLTDSYQHQAESAQASINQLKEREKENLQRIIEESKKNPKEAGKKLRSLLGEATASLKSSTPWKNFGIMSNGSSLTLNSTPYRKQEIACSLLDILETDPPERYFLSQKQTEYLLKMAAEGRESHLVSTQTTIKAQEGNEHSLPQNSKKLGTSQNRDTTASGEESTTQRD